MTSKKTEKTDGELLHAQINLVNQTMKRFTKYYYLQPENIFLAKAADSMYEVFHEVPNTDLQRLIPFSFCIEDGTELFDFFKGVDKTIELDGRELVNSKGASFHLKKIHEDTIKQEFSVILGLINDIDDDECLVDNDSTLHVGDEDFDLSESKDGLIVDSIVDILNNVIGKTVDHTIPYLELEEGSLQMHYNYADIDISAVFIILDTKAFRKPKTLMKDESFFSIFLREKRFLISYGVFDKDGELKEQTVLSGNGINRLQPLQS